MNILCENYFHYFRKQIVIITKKQKSPLSEEMNNELRSKQFVSSPSINNEILNPIHSQ
ncbi:MAG: hypothetical protein ACI9P5_003461 [Saprospiraceae bacterium]|jgi:hypothetical protein